ncbi:DUF1648 domain-containing protein [Staphylococcus delphini]|uniref:DUF1648 domain-containing protein n=1 Tax=Staphylococcus delphini TaxID=53344 RepID=UPI001F5C02AA|nr:DUF1648 domain-containing protein [Staphylococcus delphini]
MKQINRLIPVLWLISIVILARYYAQLPAQVGTHLNLNGEVGGLGFEKSFVDCTYYFVDCMVLSLFIV